MTKQSVLMVFFAGPGIIFQYRLVAVGWGMWVEMSQTSRGLISPVVWGRGELSTVR